MKYLKKFESLDEGNVELALTRIKEHFSEEKVMSMFDNEILEWVESDWEDNYESEYDWYIDHNNREAEDVIINNMINWYNSKYNSNFDFVELYDKLMEEYFN